MAVAVLAIVALLAGVDRASAQVVNVAQQPVTITPVPEQIELGPVMDVIPYVLSDGYTINLTLIPSVREFVGYDPQPQIPLVNQPNVVFVPQVYPHFRVRQVASSVNVWDGQTLVLGGLLSENSQKIKDKVPFLGDLPLVGKLFRSESTTSQKKNLLIFVTPTIIDPAGNRLHTDDEMPFAQNQVPPQPAGGIMSGRISSVPLSTTPQATPVATTPAPLATPAAPAAKR